MDYTFWIPVVISLLALIWNFWQQKSIEKLKSENEKSKLIHRIQFEKEFNIYNELWGKLIDLRNLAGALRPEVDFIDPDKTSDEIAIEKINKINDAFHSCVISFDNNKPFYPKEVYDEIEKILRLSRREARQFQGGDSRKDDYWEEGKKNIQGIIESMDKVCEIIRTRIGLIRVKE
jgi:hypothetical protein